MIIAFILVTLILIMALTISVSANMRFGNMLMNVEDNTQECVDIIDKRYYNLIHVFDESPGTINDDPLVRSFISEVHEARNDMLKIANLISRSTEDLSNIGSEKEAPALSRESAFEAQADV